MITRQAIKFERTVNLLFTRCRRISNKNLELRVDKHFTDPQDCRKNLLKINVKIRENGKKSYPDGELIGDQFYLVIDSKYYESDLTVETIMKTIEDMELRGGAYGLIICRENTKLTESLEINFQKYNKIL